MRIWELIRQSGQNVAHARLRTGLTALGVAIATGALVSMVGFAAGLQAQLEAPFEKLGLLHNIEVRTKEADESGDNDVVTSEETASATALNDGALQRFESIPGVKAAYPDLRLSEITVRHGDSSRSAYAVGLPREAGFVGFVGDLLSAGSFFSVSDQAEAILGEGLLRELDFDTPGQAVGQHVELETAGLVATESQRFEVQSRRLTVRIVGTYQPPGFATNIGARVVLLPVDLMKDLPGAVVERNLQRLRARSDTSLDDYSQVVVRAERVADVARVQESIESMGYQTEAVIEQLQDARKAFVFMEVLLTAVGTVALVVAGLGIMNTLLMTVLERYQEIGIYKAIGASDGDVRVLFLTEAAVVGMLGGIGGLLLAGVVSQGLQWGISVYAARQGVEGPIDAFRFPLWLLVGAVLFAICVSVISGLYPASRAARIDPIGALRHE